MGFYTRESYKVNEIFFKTLASARKINEIFFKIFTFSPTILYHMIGCHKEGKRGVFNSLQIVTQIFSINL